MKHSGIVGALRLSRGAVPREMVRKTVSYDPHLCTKPHFFNRLTDGDDMIKPIPYPDGSQKGCVAYMKDGAIVTVRKKSTSDGSPAVDINIKSPGRVKTQKIHFTKKEDE